MSWKGLGEGKEASAGTLLKGVWLVRAVEAGTAHGQKKREQPRCVQGWAGIFLGSL